MTQDKILLLLTKYFFGILCKRLQEKISVVSLLPVRLFFF